ncbi:MAG: hypothetical protein ABI947_26980 [Chloroflexota bacterium]
MDTQVPTTIPRSLENEIRAKVRQLSLDQLSYREIVDRLMEEGYDRALLIRVIHNMANEKRILPDYSAPIIVMVVAVALMFWGTSPSSPDAPEWLRTLKWILYGFSGIAFLPALFTIVYKVYDRIPGVNTLLEPILHKRRILQPDIVQLDTQFLDSQLPDRDYESQLVTLLGQRRGRSHFRFMRNQKHFGL